MDYSDITNNHLKDVIHNLRKYLENDEEAPFELILELVCELKVSRLLIPAIEEEDAYLFEHLESEDDDSIFLPLFTDAEEYKKHIIDNDEYELVSFDFDEYLEIMDENNFDAMFINPDGELMPLDQDFIKNFNFDFEIDIDEEIVPYEAQEIMEIFENAKNDSFLEFIRNDEINDSTEKMLVELSNSTLLAAVVSDGPLDEFAQDGIIDAEDVGGFTQLAVDDGNYRLGVLFTDKQAIESASELDTNLHYYGQVAFLSEYFENILRNDIDGVLVNPNGESYVISRSEILTQASGVEVVVDDKKLFLASQYSFVL